MTLFDFSGGPRAVSASGNGSVDSWRSVDDRVMGGVSRSKFHQADSHAIFEGVVSPENNGGFASVRAVLSEELPGTTQHVWIEARAEATSYYLNLRTDEAFDGISYRVDFAPTADWSTIELPLADFRPVFRGREVLDAPPLRPERIRQIGLMIADKQFGKFQLMVRAIGVSD